MGIYVYQSIQLTPITESLQNGFSGFFDLLGSLTGVTIQKDALSFITVQNLIPMFLLMSVCVYGNGWLLGRKVFKKYRITRNLRSYITCN